MRAGVLRRQDGHVDLRKVSGFEHHRLHGVDVGERLCLKLTGAAAVARSMTNGRVVDPYIGYYFVGPHVSYNYASWCERTCAPT